MATQACRVQQRLLAHAAPPLAAAAVPAPAPAAPAAPAPVAAVTAVAAGSPAAPAPAPAPAPGPAVAPVKRKALVLHDPAGPCLKKRRVGWTRAENEYIREWVKANTPSPGGRWAWAKCLEGGRHILHPSHLQGCKVKDAARRLELLTEKKDSSTVSIGE